VERFNLLLLFCDDPFQVLYQTMFFKKFVEQHRVYLIKRHACHYSQNDYRRGWSISEIFEICRDTEVATADELNYGLQFVFLLACHTNLAVLQLALHFEPL
jgi:hypothetical protein